MDAIKIDHEDGEKAESFGGSGIPKAFSYVGLSIFQRFALASVALAPRSRPLPLLLSILLFL
ncbi:hypothetical protein ALC62_02088 [Cyphomyrmex costatus]|uniref:Uncharacterized protein n=1 Tax=Cyphomyrmex costatus TaxID=456900 RepID=A0A151INF3_9HYME|nr:hypothetical protein ALC62_02088 [Cyphomyrmex costatus]